MSQPGIDESRKMLRMGDPILVREWSLDQFHRHVLELEKQGYLTRLETYSITPEMHPETGEITHLYSIELILPEPDRP